MTPPVAAEEESGEASAPTRWGMHRIGLHIGLGSALHALSAAVFGLTAVLVARQVSPAEFGELAVGMTVAFVGGDVLDFARSKALLAIQARGDTETRTAAMNLLRTKLIGAPAILLALALASIVVTGSLRWHILLFALYGVAYTTWLTLCIPIRARADLAKAASCALQERLVALGFVTVSVPTLGPSSLPLGLALGAMTVCARLGRPAWVCSGNPLDERELWNASKHFAVVSFTTDARQLDVPVVATIAGAGLGGLFAAASRLIGPMSIVGQQASVLVFAAASTTSDSLTRRGLARILGTLTALYVPLLALLTWKREPIVTFLLGEQYRWSTDLIPGLCLGLLLNLVNDPLIGWAQARGQARLASRACTLSVLAYLAVLAVGAHTGSALVLALAFPTLNGLSLAILLSGLVREDRRPARRCPTLGTARSADDPLPDHPHARSTLAPSPSPTGSRP